MPFNRTDLDTMDGYQFEKLIENLVQNMGFITKEKKIGADGGIDILAFNTKPIFQGEYIIQCKRYTSPVGVSFIRDLYGVVHSKNANKGVLITNSYFTKQAQDFAENKQLELIDGDKLISLLLEYNVLDKSDVENQVIFLNGVNVFKYTLIEPLKIILKKVEENKKGVIYVPIKHVGIKFWENHIDNENTNMKVYLNSMVSTITYSSNYMNSNEIINVKNVQESCKQAIKNTELFYDHYYKTLSIRPPDKYLNAHIAWLNVYYEIFWTWEKLVTDFEKSINNPPPGGKILLEVVYEGNSIEAFNEEIDKLKGGCFIVSASFGSSLSKEVDVFRNYRNIVLSNNAYGIKIINYYYKYSPFFSNIISKSVMMKKLIRKLILVPLLFILKKKGYGKE